MKRYYELDDYGLVRIPWLFYLVLLVTLRPFLVWVVVLTMQEGADTLMRSIYPKTQDFVVACLIAAPALLLAIALSRRTEKGWRAWFVIWRYARWPLLLVVCVDFTHSLWKLPSFVMVNAPWLLLAPSVLLIGALWLLKSQTMRQVFSEWPESAVKPKVGAKV